MKTAMFHSLMALPFAGLLFVCDAFVVPGGPAFFRSTKLMMVGSDDNVILGGNSDWKPEPGGMQATDVGDYFPDDYNPDDGPAFADGMGGSQAKMGGGGIGTAATPGMEDFGKGGTVIGGLDERGVPEGFEFIPSSVSDGEHTFEVAGSSTGVEYTFNVKPFCMGYEDFYAGFADGSHPSLAVQPTSGRMDRRGGEESTFTIQCLPNGKAGTFEGNLVIVLPEENEKLTYKIVANAY